MCRSQEIEGANTSYPQSSLEIACVFHYYDEKVNGQIIVSYCNIRFKVVIQFSDLAEHCF